MGKIKVLIVDDTFFMRETLRRYLDGDKYEVLQAENGLEGVKLYKEQNPLVVTMDITMPEMDGVEALKHIKEYDKTAVVMMSTALGQESYVKECVRYGCSNYIVKPFSKEVYIEKIDELVKRAVLAKKCAFGEKDCGACPYADICRIDK